MDSTPRLSVPRPSVPHFPAFDRAGLVRAVLDRAEPNPAQPDPAVPDPAVTASAAPARAVAMPRRAALGGGRVMLALACAALLGVSSPIVSAQQAPPASPQPASPQSASPQPASPGPASPGPASPGAASPGAARVMTLDEALALADAKSEQVRIAQAGVTRAQGGELRAKSELYPQVSASASYDRALASEFEGIFDATGPSCTPLTVNPAAPLADRISEIERALQDCPPSSDFFGGGGGSGDGSGDGGDNDLPFGQANTVRLGLQFSQNLYSGGRIGAQRDRARLDRTNADLTLNSTRAQLSFDVAQAYYDASLSDRLVVIAEETLAQAGRTYDQTRAQREAGRLSEFDLLRAQVARDTQRPEVIRRRNARDLAYLRLKQLLDLPLDTALQLATRLDAEILPAPAQRFANAVAEVEAGAAARERIAIAQAANDVQSREADVRVARAQRLPAVSVTSSYGRIAYPSDFTTWTDLRTNWTVGVGLSLPLFTGWRIKADEIIARASVTETEARLQLTRELATLDAASTRLNVTDARAAWEATGGTVAQAQRAYEIAELRYKEGISTQLELSDARLLLQQAQANRAQAARDVQVARVRLALLPDLPLTTTGANTPSPQTQMGAAAPGAASGQTSPQGGQTSQTPAGQAAPGTVTTGSTGAPPR